MVKLFFNTYLTYLNKINSTNIFLKKILNKKNWTVIWTKNQTEGKGTNNKKWYTEIDKCLTFSIYLNPNIKINNFYILNMIVCNAIHKIIFLYHKDTWIKWPNDIILMNKKICGILIENTIHKNIIVNSIIGIGINILKMNFNYIKNASSLEDLLNIKIDIKFLLIQIIFNIQKEYILYIKNDINKIKNYYIKYLYKRNIISRFRIGKNIKVGIIKEITKSGKLVIFFLNDKKLYTFNTKEISMYY